MKKERVKQLDVGSTEPDIKLKPYGFCCNIKDEDARLFAQKEDREPLFSSNDPYPGGPDIKVRIQEDDDVLYSRYGRSGVRAGLRGGYRGGIRSKHRSGQQINWSDQPRSRQRKPRDGYRVGATKSRRLSVGLRRPPIEPVGQRMKCKRCRGPLKRFLEDEINDALEKMMRNRQKKYNEEMEKNIKISKEKERRKQKKGKLLRKIKKSKDDAAKEDTSKEDTHEN